MGDIVNLTKRQNVDDLLKEAMGKFELVVVVGIDAQGEMLISSCVPSYSAILHILNRAKQDISYSGLR